MNGWGIRARVLFLALAPSLMILFALVGYFTYERIAEVESSRAERGALVARRLVPAAEFALFAGDRDTLQKLAAAAAREADVGRVSIRDASGELLAEFARPDAALDPSELMPVTEPVLRTRLAATDVPEQEHAAAPPKLGEITVVMTRSATRAEQRRLLLTGLALGLAGLAIAITLALAIGESVIRPIRRLARAMVELEHGRAAVPLASAGGGEFRTLAQGFNSMAARLQADARELEARIEAATAALIAEKDTAEQATQAKSRFIAAASHDLRQPLHAIGLFTATLQRRTAGTQLEEVAGELGKAVAAMDRLLHSLLDISRLDAGTLRAEPRRFALQHLFSQIAAEHADAARQKGLRLRVRPTPVALATDELLLHRILTNLVANAIRYTRTGGVLVCARVRGTRVRIEVRDSGIGIPKDKHEDVFREFFQIAGAERDRAMGLGLGLAIVSRLAELLGTSVALRSAPALGSVFSLELPRAERVGASAPGAAPPAAPASEASPARVLVIDDDPLVLSGNRALLEQFGCRVATVSDRAGAEAALAAFGDEPVLVLCDMRLDGDNGIDVLRRLASKAGAPLSAVLISGDTGPETMHAARDAGYALLHKPLAPAKLRALVMQFSWTLRDVEDAETVR